MRKIEIEIDGVIGSATLLDEQAPKITQALWDALPVEDRTIHTMWSGQAWRTEGNYKFREEDEEIENKQTYLDPGDIIYYTNFEVPLLKIGMAYGRAQWRAPDVDRYVTVVAKIDENFEGLQKACQKIILEGPKKVVIRRKEG